MRSVLVTASEFRKNQKKYFQTALQEKIGVKSGDVIFEITPSKDLRVNPSPSGDPFWNDSRNLDALDVAINAVNVDVRSGKYKEYPTWEQVRKKLAP